ncbi:MAG: NUDIX domain-containing protein [Bacilli bacterium]|nr:NUDIX domain-containing protein [Bacilli bacterium]
MSKRDIRLMIEDVKFSVRAVGVLRKNNRILFQKRKGDEFWALPGGAIEVLERAKDVITRELEEEIGLKDVEVMRPLWFVEYFFKFNNLDQHQYIIGYLLNIDDNNEIINKEEFDGIEEGKNIIYKWIDINNLQNEKIKPDYLKDKLLTMKDNFEFIEEDNL